MADAVVNIKLSPVEHRLLVSELTHHADGLKVQATGTKKMADKQAIRRREAALRFMLEKI